MLYAPSRSVSDRPRAACEHDEHERSGRAEHVERHERAEASQPRAERARTSGAVAIAGTNASDCARVANATPSAAPSAASRRQPGSLEIADAGANAKASATG